MPSDSVTPIRSDLSARGARDGRRGAGYSYGVTILPLPACYREDTPPECVQFHLLPPVGGILGVFAQPRSWWDSGVKMSKLQPPTQFVEATNAVCGTQSTSHLPRARPD